MEPHPWRVRSNSSLTLVVAVVNGLSRLRAKRNLPTAGDLVPARDLLVSQWQIKRQMQIVYVKEQMGHSSIQVTVDTYGHLIPARMCLLLDEPPVKEAKTSPQLPRNKAKWRFRRISCKVLRRLVAAVGLEPTTYGL